MGAHVARELIAGGHEVVVLDDLSGGFEDNIPAGAQFVHGSITDHALVDRLFDQHRFEYVYHLGAYAAEGLSHFIKRFNYTNNLIGSVNLINASIRTNVKCFVFTSSIAVYGALKPPMREDMTPHPEDPYGIAKLAVEQELKVSKAQFGLNSVIFRPHNVYGEYQNIGDRYRNVVGIFMNQLLQGKELTVFGDGLQSRAFTYVGDIAPFIAQAAWEPRAQNRIFNVGADQPTTVKELAEITMRAMGITGSLRFLAPRNEVQHAWADHSAVRDVFGPGRNTSLDEGLRRMAAWVRSVGSRKSQAFSNIEIERGLPAVWLEE